MTLPLALFVAAVVAWTLVSFALSLRHSAHVRTHRGEVPPDFASEVSAADHRKAADYTMARERLARFETLAEAVLTLAWVFGGIGLLYGLVAAFIPPSLTRGVVFLILTSVVGALVGLPFGLLRAFWLEQKFGFNRTTPLTFTVDKLKGALIGLVVATPLLYLLLAVMRAASRLWWLYAWIGLVVLMLLAPTVFVRFIAPRFNRFEALADADLKRRIETLLGRTGFRASGLFSMDASRRTAHGNAYFIGFGRTKRIVLFDTLLARHTPEEIEAVVAHELGHFKHRHVLFGVVQGAAMLFGMLALFGWLAPQPWLLPAFGIAVHDDAVALFLCSLIAGQLGPLLAPLSNWVSRRNEYQADDFARRAVGADPMVSALTRLARDNATTLTPDPLYALMHYSHPPVPLRVRHLRASEPAAAPAAAAPALG